MSEPVRLLCLAGTSQNGATLLTRMLGRLPGFVAVGEIGYLWDKGLIENVDCGCGEPFHDCPFWSDVGERAFGGWGRVDASEAVRLRGAVKLRGKRLAQARALPLLVRPQLSATYGRALRAYGHLMMEVYRAVAASAGGDVIVDSMKQPAHVYMARTLSEVERFRVAHLVRDPRGFATSNLKWVERQGDNDRLYRTRRPPWKATALWDFTNAAFEAMPALGVSALRVRYEDVVMDPREQLSRISSHAGVTVGPDDLSFVSDGSVALEPDHLVAGNRMRLASGWTELRIDDGWRTTLTRSQARTVDAFAWPLMRRYGYRAA
jgi:Sulfotransferase family